ncbi:SLC13 family permease [Chromatiaceae bacterium AAb-1]|nr:SLC13 family permease [Chromatiaceae bacterium AAb-1]
MATCLSVFSKFKCQLLALWFIRGVMPSLRLVLSRLSEDLLLLILMLALIPLLWRQPELVPELPGFIDWHTLTALAGLMLLSRGLEDSGYLTRFAGGLVSRSYSLRAVALTLVMFAALLSAVVTNDVALFILVPVCLSVAKLTGVPVGRLVIFLALAVNAGSAVSPVGNPQNLLLWQASGYSFGQFMLMMAPLTVLLMAVLLLFTWQAFSPAVLRFSTAWDTKPARPWLFRCSLLGYPLFIVAMEYGFAPEAAVLIFCGYLLCCRQVLWGIDWLLLLVFTLMFVDLGLLARLPVMAEWVNTLQTLPGSDYTATALISQLISNVPAAIFMQHFSDDWRALSWGASVGGFGIVVGSLANLIALRLAKQPGLWREFHLWSLPVFFISFVLGWLLL